MKKSRKPMVAGLMNALFGIPVIVNSIRVIVDYYVNHPWRDVNIAICLVTILSGLIALLSGWLCISRKNWWMALSTSMSSIPGGLVSAGVLASLFPPDTFLVSIPIFAILGFVVFATPTILIIFSKKDFIKSGGVLEVTHGA
jgi:hypothetical protein